MGKTTNLGLHTTATNETSKTFLEYRTEMSGPNNDSNMVMIDAAIGKNKRDIASANAEITSVKQNITTMNSDLNSKIAEVRQRQTMPYTFKGSCTYAELQSKTNANINDYWYVTDLYYDMAYNGESWEQSSFDKREYESDLDMLKADSDRYSESLVAAIGEVNIRRITDTESGTYTSSTGEKAGTAVDNPYLRTKNRFRAVPFAFAMSEQVSTTVRVTAFFYDKDGAFIISRPLQNPDDYKYNLVMSITPANAAYMTISGPAGTFPEEITVKFIAGDGKAQNIDINYTRDRTSYVVIRNAYANGISGLTSSTLTDAVFIPNVNAQKIFTSYLMLGTASVPANRCVALFDSYPILESSESYEVLTPTYVQALTSDAQDTTNVACMYDIPEGTRGVLLTFPKSLQINADGEVVSYANILRDDDRPLAMQKILCIGDSISWLDGAVFAFSGDTGRMVGYQKQLRYAGAIVDTLGFNGLPLAKSDARYSAYSGIVENGVDVSEYDKIIIFLGGNDAIYNIPIGDIPEKYKTPDFDVYTMCGAYGAMVWYIRTHNPDCKIYNVIVGKSQDGARYFEKVINYREALMKCGLFWSTPVVDLFTLDNTSPWVTNQSNPDSTTMTQFRYYHYDGTHYNYKGRMRIGKIILNHIVNDFGTSVSTGIKSPDVLANIIIAEGEIWDE